MRLENLLRGMTIPGKISNSRRKKITKQLSKDERTLFVVQNLIGEIVRLNKLRAREKGSVHFYFCQTHLYFFYFVLHMSGVLLNL